MSLRSFSQELSFDFRLDVIFFPPIRPLWVQDPRKVEGGIIKDKFLKALIEKILAFDELFTPRRSLLLLEQNSYTNQKLHMSLQIRYVVAKLLDFDLV